MERLAALGQPKLERPIECCRIEYAQWNDRLDGSDVCRIDNRVNARSLRRVFGEQEPLGEHLNRRWCLVRIETDATKELTVRRDLRM